MNILPWICGCFIFFSFKSFWQFIFLLEVTEVLTTPTIPLAFCLRSWSVIWFSFLISESSFNYRYLHLQVSLIPLDKEGYSSVLQLFCYFFNSMHGYCFNVGEQTKKKVCCEILKIESLELFRNYPFTLCWVMGIVWWAYINILLTSSLL